MRLLIAFSGIAWLSRAAQVGAPAENTPLQNTGKPMMVDYLCGEEDIRLAGLSCTIDDPCPVFLELASVEAVGNRIFVAGNIHSSIDYAFIRCCWPATMPARPGASRTSASGWRASTASNSSISRTAG
jgi:hypothetical protein